LKPVSLETIQIEGGQSKKSNQEAGFVAGFFMLMLMYMTVLIYGMNVMRSVLEEKGTRILEVLLSTATAQELMAGKILGVGAVGLTQIGIWGILSAVYVTPMAMSGALSSFISIFRPVPGLRLAYFFCWDIFSTAPSAARWEPV